MTVTVRLLLGLRPALPAFPHLGGADSAPAFRPAPSGVAGRPPGRPGRKGGS